MVGFAQWFVLQERSLVDPGVVDSYERAFHEQLEALIQRTHDPELRRALEAMRQFRFANAIVGALVRHGVHQQFDVDDSLQRIVFRMLSPVGERGLPHSTLFDLDQSRQYDLHRGNPLEARFRTYLSNEIKNIATGRIPALRRTQRPGSLSIGYGDQDQGTVSPDQIPGRVASHEEELMNDIVAMLRQRSTPQMPLVNLFNSIMAGEGLKVQRARFGFDRANEGRQIIMQVIRQYAYQSQNWHLLQLLDKIQNPEAKSRQPPPPPKPPKPKLPPDQQDYRSIVQVLEKNGRSASMQVFGSQRSRWLERKPRDAASPYDTRLHDVLAKMVQAGVLNKVGARYIPGQGQQYSRFLTTQEPVAVA